MGEQKSRSNLKNAEDSYTVINYLWIFLLSVLLFFSYEPILRKILIRWSTGDNSYCYLIFPLFLYLCWEKRKSFNFRQFSGSYWGLFVLLVAIAIILIGELASLETLLYFGFWLSIVSLALVLYGKRSKRLAFPLLILVFIVPLPPFINRLLTFRLQLLMSSLSVSILRLLGISVFQEGNIIDLGVEQLQVVEACSGLRYFMPLILIALLISHYYLRRFWSKMILLVSVIPVSIIANSFRISFTGLLYTKNLKKWAQGFYHNFSGWLVFVVAGGLLLGISFVLRAFDRSQKDSKVAENTEEITPLPRRFAPLICGFVFIVIMGGILLRMFPKNYISPVETSLASFPMQIDKWRGQKYSLSPKILNALWADEYVSAYYYREDLPGVIHLFIPYYSYQTTRHTAHAPQSCLLGSGWVIISSGEWRLEVEPGKVIPVRYMRMRKGQQQLLATYFFFQRGRVITSPWWNKFYLLWDGITRRRTDGALVRVEMQLASGQSFEEAEGELREFLIHLWPELKKFIPE